MRLDLTKQSILEFEASEIIYQNLNCPIFEMIIYIFLFQKPGDFYRKQTVCLQSMNQRVWILRSYNYE